MSKPVPINIMLSCNTAFFKLQKLSLLNLCRSNASENIHIYFLNISLSDSEVQELRDLVEANSSFKFVCVKVKKKYIDFVDRQAKFWECQFGLYWEQFIRTCIPVMFPNLTKALWLDADVFVIKPIREIYDVDLGDNYLAGYYDGCKWCCGDHFKVIMQLYGLSPDSYVNNGICFMNLDAMRKYMSLERQENLNKKLGKWFVHYEQDSFNLLSAKHKLVLPSENAYIIYRGEDMAPESDDVMNDYLSKNNVVFIHTTGTLKIFRPDCPEGVDSWRMLPIDYDYEPIKKVVYEPFKDLL